MLANGIGAGRIAPFIATSAYTIAKTALANPKITALTIGLITSPAWVLQAKAGIVAYVMCVEACLAGMSIMVPGGVIIAVSPPCLIQCKAGCTPFLAPNLP